jgi:hypothetical protein
VLVVVLALVLRFARRTDSVETVVPVVVEVFVPLELSQPLPVLDESELDESLLEVSVLDELLLAALTKLRRALAVAVVVVVVPVLVSVPVELSSSESCPPQFPWPPYSPP